MYHAGAVYIYDLSSGNLTFANYKTMLYSSDRASRFGKHLEGQRIEVVNWRVEGFADAPATPR
jgi:hypothetical protein